MPTSDPSAVRAWAKQIAAKYNASNWANDKMDWRDLVRADPTSFCLRAP
jgi:hypothetical protein